MGQVEMGQVERKGCSQFLGRLGVFLKSKISDVSLTYWEREMIKISEEICPFQVRKLITVFSDVPKLSCLATDPEREYAADLLTIIARAGFVQSPVAFQIARGLPSYQVLGESDQARDESAVEIFKYLFMSNCLERIVVDDPFLSKPLLFYGVSQPFFLALIED